MSTAEHHSDVVSCASTVKISNVVGSTLKGEPSLLVPSQAKEHETGRINVPATPADESPRYSGKR